MFQIERLQKIRQILIAEKSVSVIELSDRLDVSEITIRRDFEKLEKDGFLQRTHGGAVLGPNYKHAQMEQEEEAAALPPALQNIPSQTIALGRMCADIVEDYDVVFLGRCPSNAVMAQCLREKTEVVVVTNYLEVMNAMRDDKQNRVILTGGEVDYDKMMIRGGGFADFPSINLTKAFIHVQGMDFANGVTVNDSEDRRIYEYLRNKAAEIIIVVEGVLFGRVGLFKIDDLENVTAIATDDRIPDAYKNQLYRKGVQLYQKFNL